jgi:hypothetical protein
MRFFLRLATILLCAFPAALRAQAAPDTATTIAPAVFAYLQYGDTIGFEAVRSDSAMVRGVFLIPKQARIGWDHFLVDSKPASLRLTLYPGEDLLMRPAVETDYELVGDSMLVLTRRLDGVDRDMRSTTADAVPAFGRSMTHLAYLAFYAAQSRIPTLPLFLTSSGKTVTAAVQVLGEVVTITVEGLRIETYWEDGTLSEVRVPSQGLVVRRVEV